MKRNHKGYRIGESHHRAELTDHDVELMRELHDGGMRPAEIARKFEANLYTTIAILNYKSRYA